MQVYSIDSTNFGMLRIMPRAEKTLKSLPLEQKTRVIASLEKAAYDLQDTKYCHLEIGEDLTPTIDTGFLERFKGVFNMINPEDNHVQFGTIYDGRELGGRTKGDRIIATYKAKSKAAAKELVEQLKNEPDNISLAARLTKFIDESILGRFSETKAVNKAENSLDKRIDILMQNNDYYRL